MEATLIAPCGMNCGICMAYLRPKNKCLGCFKQDPYERGSSLRRCSIRNCETIKNNASGFCYECPTFPCKRLKQLDKRYRTNYHMSMIENLEYIRDNGMKAFLEKESQKWKCPECGGTICCHNGLCFNCDLEKLKAKKRKYRWTDD